MTSNLALNLAMGRPPAILQMQQASAADFALSKRIASRNLAQMRGIGESAGDIAADIALDATLSAAGPEGMAVAAILNIVGIKGSDIVNFVGTVVGRDKRNARGLTEAGEAAQVFFEKYDPSTHEDIYTGYGKFFAGSAACTASVQGIADHYGATIGPALRKKILDYYNDVMVPRQQAADAAKAAKDAADAARFASFKRVGARAMDPNWLNLVTAPPPAPPPMPDRPVLGTMKNLRYTGGDVPPPDGPPPSTKPPAAPLTTTTKVAAGVSAVAVLLGVFSLVGKFVR